MESMYILVPLSLILGALIIYFFWWSSKSGQFDDLEGPAHRILRDDDSYREPERPSETQRPSETRGEGGR